MAVRVEREDLITQCARVFGERDGESDEEEGDGFALLLVRFSRIAASASTTSATPKSPARRHLARPRRDD